MSIESAPIDDDDGYRPRPAGGPRLRSDVVDVYIFRPAKSEHSKRSLLVETRGEDGRWSQRPSGVEFLQILRARDPLKGTWQPVMGHVERGETAVECAVRELREELGLESAGPDLVAMWALEQVHPFYIAAIDCIVLSPRFAAQVAPGWEPRLNPEHSDHRWVSRAQAWRRFMWPGQVAACTEITEHLLRNGSLCREALRIPGVGAASGAAPEERESAAPSEAAGSVEDHAATATPARSAV